jgi:hypothetical protein
MSVAREDGGGSRPKCGVGNPRPDYNRRSLEGSVRGLGIRLLIALAIVAAMLLPPDLPAQAQTTRPRNNIVGLNVARLWDPNYIRTTAEFANANGGEWGYITIAWTRVDRDRWGAEGRLKELLDLCVELRLNPIIRVGTEFDLFDKVWAHPVPDEAERWKSFFDRVEWPFDHVWVIAGNEPNLGREWNGAVDARAYARFLEHFLNVFDGSPRFRVVNGPMDISNGTELPMMQDAFQFLAEMRSEVPNIFDRLPAWASNPYQVPSGGGETRYTHRAYEAELAFIGRDIPVLITESHAQETEDDEEIARYFETAFKDWMNDPRVVAATPLFWHPDTNIFWMFALSDEGHFRHKSLTYERLIHLPRIAGSKDFRPGVVAAAPPAATPRPAPTTLVAPKPETAVAPRGRHGRIANTEGRGANLRESPGVVARQLKLLAEGVEVSILDKRGAVDGRDWHRVATADGVEGWVASEYLAEE